MRALFGDTLLFFAIFGGKFHINAVSDHSNCSEDGDNYRNVKAGMYREERVDRHEKNRESESKKTETIETRHALDGIFFEESFFAFGVGEISFAKNGLDTHHADDQREDYSCYSTDCK